jgi:pSer/pThr/pTyr-binding forkhead associated (FHA) protein
VFIGSADYAGLQIDDPGAAEMHCAVRVDTYGRVLLLDLGSGKDTHVNGNWTASHVLEPGDVIGIGATEIEFQLRGAG